MDKEFFSVRTLARYLDVSEQTVYRLAHEGQIPYVRMGRLLRFNKAAVEEYLQRESEEEFDGFW